MNYFNLIFIIAFVAFAYLVARTVSRTNRSDKHARLQFLERESLANSTRKADISALPYIKIPLDTLPLDALDAAGLTKEKTNLCRFCEQRILNLSMYTNTDLKMLYGPANLDTLSACDDAYTDLIRLLNTIGASLAGQGHTDEAKKFLAYAVSIGSDIRATYGLLATLCAETGDTGAIDRLLEQAQTLTSLSKPAIINNLHSIKSQTK